MQDKLIELEKKLMTIDARANQQFLTTIIADNFLEIGSTGKVYNKTEVIDSLLLSKSSNYDAFDFNVTMITSAIFLLHYKTKTSEENFVHITMRTSLWEYKDEQWLIVYHQATPQQMNIT